MKEICILGNGVTAYILALLLNQNKIYISEKDMSHTMSLSNVISLKINDMTDDENKFLKSKIDYSDCIVTKKAGYKFNNEIFSEADDEMIKNYLLKQNRNIVYDFKFETEYSAINIIKLIYKYKDKIQVLNENELPRNNAIYIITNKQVKNDGKNSSEYIINEKNDMHGYSYIYDCNLYSNVKRYSEDFTECINEVEGAKEVKNYYEKPKYYFEYDIKKDNLSIYIGRYASKTRIEQIDVLRFCMKFLKIIKGDNK